MPGIPLVMTAAPRDYATHARCLASVRSAGFDHATICAEPNTLLFSPRDRIIMGPEKLGQWRNFVRAVRVGALSTSGGPFVTCEDDVVFCSGLAQALEQLRWPASKCGVIQLYSAKAYRTRTEPDGTGHAAIYSGGLNRLRTAHALDMLGACALLWNHEAAEQLVKWADEKGWRGDVTRVIDDPVDKKAGDTFVGEVLTFLGWEIWMHLPSLVGHIGINSTLGHQSQGVDDNREAADFPGERTDAREVCGWWPYIKRGTATNGSRRRSPVSTTTLTRS